MFGVIKKMGHCMGIITLKMKVENGYIILIFTLMVVLHLFNLSLIHI